LSDRQIDAVIAMVAEEELKEVRTAAERAVSTYAKSKAGTRGIANKLVKAYGDVSDSSAKEAYLRLLGSTGHELAVPVVKKALKSGEDNLQLAALTALENWRDDKNFDLHFGTFQNAKKPFLREEAFASLLNFLTGRVEIKPKAAAGYWKAISSEAKSSQEKLQVINRLAAGRKPWSAQLVKPFLQDSDESVKALAERAMKALEKKPED